MKTFKDEFTIFAIFIISILLLLTMTACNNSVDNPSPSDDIDQFPNDIDQFPNDIDQLPDDIELDNNYTIDYDEEFDVNEPHPIFGYPASWKYGDEWEPIALYGSPGFDEESNYIWNRTQIYLLQSGSYDSKARSFTRMMWDEEYVYLKVYINDLDVISDENRTFENYNIDIFISGNYESPSAPEEWVPSEGEIYIGVKPDGEYVDYMKENGYEEFARSNIETDVRLEGLGYIVKVKIPWDDIIPVEEQHIGFDIQVKDLEGNPVALSEESLSYPRPRSNFWEKVRLVTK